jgi:hypothetical protein
MSTNYSAVLYAGISLEEFFKKVGTKSEFYDEHDSRGNKTGKKIEEKKLIATLPDGGEVVIGEYYKSYGRDCIKYDFYSSLSFDGSESDQTDLELFESYETEDLSEMILGYRVKETADSKGYNEDSFVMPIDSVRLNQLVATAKQELERIFGYKGIVKLYLINSVS